MSLLTLSLYALFISLFLSYLLTPTLIKFSENKKIGLSHPDLRKIHKRSISQLGGIAIYLSFIITILLIAKIEKHILGIIIGGSLIFLLGLRDDIKEIPAGIKLAIQLISASILLLFGVKIIFISNPFGEIIYLGYWGVPLTLLWIVGVTNAMNFIDGLDGLACGISIIAGTIFLILSGIQKVESNLFILSSVVVGSCLGFLRYNFHPAKIFMGDSGAYFLGFVLSSIAVIGTFKSVATLAIIAPVLILGIPILDVLLSIIRRIRKGESTFTPDREHIHHKLLEVGLTQRQTVLLIYLASIFLGIIALFLAK